MNKLIYSINVILYIVVDSDRYKSIWDLLYDHMDEKFKRLVDAVMAQSFSYGGQKVICELTRVSRATVKYEVAQLTGKALSMENESDKVVVAVRQLRKYMLI